MHCLGNWEKSVEAGQICGHILNCGSCGATKLSSGEGVTVRNVLAGFCFPNERVWVLRIILLFKIELIRRIARIYQPELRLSYGELLFCFQTWQRLCTCLNNPAKKENKKKSPQRKVFVILHTSQELRAVLWYSLVETGTAIMSTSLHCLKGWSSAREGVFSCRFLGHMLLLVNSRKEPKAQHLNLLQSLVLGQRCVYKVDSEIHWRSSLCSVCGLYLQILHERILCKGAIGMLTFRYRQLFIGERNLYAGKCSSSLALMLVGRMWLKCS